MHSCPKCGNLFENEESTLCECGFDFNNTITCPYKISNKCVHTNIECKVIGLDYEDCEIFNNKSGMNM